MLISCSVLWCWDCEFSFINSEADCHPQGPMIGQTISYDETSTEPEYRGTLHDNFQNYNDYLQFLDVRPLCEQLRGKI